MKRKEFFIALIILFAVSIFFILSGLYKLYIIERKIEVGKVQMEHIINSYKEDDNIANIIQQNNNNEKDQICNGIGLLIFKTKSESIVAIYDGTTNEALENGAGRFIGSAMLNKTGNCVLYGHRDSVFRELKKLKESDIIIVKTKDETINYMVDNIYITDPDDESIHEYSDKKRLTLVTCYPFTFVGPSPKRCVVVAYEIP